MPRFVIVLQCPMDDFIVEVFEGTLTEATNRARTLDVDSALRRAEDTYGREASEVLHVALIPLDSAGQPTDHKMVRDLTEEVVR